jgi:hypothetical protein
MCWMIYIGITLIVLGLVCAGVLAGFINVPFSIPLSENAGFVAIFVSLGLSLVGMITLIVVLLR